MIDFDKILYFDGGMGTMLQRSVLKPGEQPEKLNLTHPEAVLDVHRQYAEAGCDIVKTNTFGLNPIKFPAHGEVEKIAAAAVGLARRAAGDKLVAIDCGPTGKLLKPYGDLDFEEAVAAFAEVMSAGERHGADLVLIETMSDLYELKAAILAAKESTSLPIFATVTLDEHGKLLTGADIAAVVALAEGTGVTAVGINCGLGPKQVKKLFETMREYASIPIILNPNAGLPQVRDGVTFFDVSPADFAAEMRELAEMGAAVMGGCCGTTPEHIREMAHVTKSITPRPAEKKGHTIVSSYGKTVIIGEETVIIGERINPTGKPDMEASLREGDWDYIVDEAFDQIDGGAQILDVNAGLPDFDEAAAVETIVTELQKITNTPLQIDSASPAVMERALRVYNGKALVNSVSGVAESMAAIFPIVKKYGGVAVAMTFDENGIPETAEGRLEIARRIVGEAQRHGIDKKDIIVDPLALTGSMGAEQADITLDALKLIKAELGVKTMLGVSNVSFGMPDREAATAEFYKRAVNAGLDAAIINPDYL